jgi:hypothetical protein
MKTCAGSKDLVNEALRHVMPLDIVEADVLQSVTELRRKRLAGTRLAVKIRPDVQEGDRTLRRAGRCTRTHLRTTWFFEKA